MEKSKRSEATLRVRRNHEDDHGMNGDSNLSQTVCVYLNKENSQGTMTLTTRKRDYKTNKLSCGSIHSVHESLDVLVSFFMLQFIAHVVVLVALFFCQQFNCCQCTKIIHFLTCTGIPCRDSHCENGLVRCCLYKLGVKAIKFHASLDFAATRSCSPRPRCFSCICRFDMARGSSL